MKTLKFVLVAALLLLAVPTLAAPGNFGLKYNPLPDGTIITEDLIDPLVVVTQKPSSVTRLTWYLWTGTKPGTPATAAESRNLVEISSPETEWFLVVPEEKINRLYEGDYIWTIVAFDSSGSSSVMSEGYLTFTIDRPDIPTPDNGDILTGPVDFVFPDNGSDWYKVWIGKADYSYTGLSKWYQADDDSVSGTPGAGICAEGFCTIPAEDTVNIYIGGNGTYVWWLTYWSPDYPKVNNHWSKISTFTLAYPAPPTTFPSSTPADDSTVNTIPTEITWDEDLVTLWYRIYLGPEALFNKWVFAGDICVAGTCTLDLAANSITLEDLTTYEVWIEMWGPGGYSKFTDITDNPLTFTIDVGA